MNIKAKIKTALWFLFGTACAVFLYANLGNLYAQPKSIYTENMKYLLTGLAIISNCTVLIGAFVIYTYNRTFLPLSRFNAFSAGFLPGSWFVCALNALATDTTNSAPFFVILGGLLSLVYIGIVCYSDNFE